MSSKIIKSNTDLCESIHFLIGMCIKVVGGLIMGVAKYSSVSHPQQKILYDSLCVFACVCMCM